MIVELLFIICLTQINLIHKVSAGCGVNIGCHIDKVVDKVTDLGRDINSVATKIDNVVTDVGTTIPNTLTTIQNKVNTAVTDVGTTIPNTLTTIQNKVNTVVTDVGTTIPNTLATIQNKVNTVVADVGTTIPKTLDDIVTDVRSTIPNTLDGIVTDVGTRIPNTLTSITGKIESVATDVVTGVADELGNLFTDFTDALDDMSGFFNNIVGDVQSQINKLKGEFKDLATVFDTNLGNIDIDPFLKSILNSNVLPQEWLDLIPDIVQFIADNAGQLLDSSIPSVVRRRRRLSSRSRTSQRRLQGGCVFGGNSICSETTAEYSSGITYSGYVTDLVHIGDDFKVAKKLYSDGQFYTVLKLYARIFSIIRDYVDIADDLLESCITLKEGKCAIHVVTKGVLIGLFSTAIWVVEFFSEAYDIHDGMLQATQIEKIFKDQSIIIGNQKTIYDFVEAALVSNAYAVGVEKVEKISVDGDRYLNETEMRLFLMSVVLLASAVVICAMTTGFIKVYGTINIQKNNIREDKEDDVADTPVVEAEEVELLRDHH